MISQTARNLMLAGLLALPAACDKALVYGDRTGFNLAIRTDAAEGHPLEVNAGLQRRVVGYVPPRKRDGSGAPVGEAVNMVSKFDLQRTAGATGGLDDTITIRAAFASGQAAIKAAKEPAAVARIAKGPEITLSADPGDKAVRNKLWRFIVPEQNLATYLALARQQGLTVADAGTPRDSAMITIGNPANAAGNRRIAAALNL